MTYMISESTRSFEVDGAFPLSQGGKLDGVRVAYRTWGRPSSSAILVCHALTGSADADVWWAGMFGTGRAFDPDRDFIVAANVLGGCYGTTGPANAPPGGDRYGPDFPAVTIGDMVELEKLLLDHLGVDRLELVIGGSMGGMQALSWAERYSEMVDAIVPIGVGSAQSAWALAISEAQRAAITGDQRFRDGRYEPTQPPTSGLATARMIAMCSYRSADDFDTRFGRELNDDTYAAQSYLRYQGTKLVERFDANSYLTLIEAMDGYRVDPSAIETPALVIGISSDVLYPVQEVRALAAALPQAEFCLLAAPQGHDAFLIETNRLNRLITSFRKRLANGWNPSRPEVSARGAAWF
ncbi:homoserine O-acetyltransferase [bacterium BMS3Abin02]|nr:homoserine O-acetyltransferase [bacterium BMS3Abin02]GBE23237.1 homoserine O-acetyltransferase [bacterium BMS3Bbin01]HDH26629.1 homoserine O-acetyltransferase [Actinomycetota bacterium]